MGSVGRRERALTEKQKRFAASYAGPAKGNATEAARQAGYKGNAKTLGVVGAENLAKPGVRNLVQKLLAEVRSAEVGDMHELRAFLFGVMRGTRGRTEVMRNGEPVREKDGTIRTRPPAVKERVRANEILMRASGAFIDKIEVKTTDAIEAQLLDLQKRMPPAAFEALIEALAGPEDDDE